MAKNILIPCTCPDCGTERMVERNALKRSPNGGLCRSCSCRRLGFEYGRNNGRRNRTHGDSLGGPLYHRWNGIKQRCHNPTALRFDDYGGRGITMYAEWREDFVAFREYVKATLGPPPSPDHTLDRIDNDGNYEPGNLRWATSAEQNNNKRSNHLLTFNGETHTIFEWADILDMNVWTLWARLFKYNWPAERALTEPLHPRRLA